MWVVTSRLESRQCAYLQCVWYCLPATAEERFYLKVYRLIDRSNRCCQNSEKGYGLSVNWEWTRKASASSTLPFGCTGTVLDITSDFSGSFISHHPYLAKWIDKVQSEFTWHCVPEVKLAQPSGSVCVWWEIILLGWSCIAWSQLEIRTLLPLWWRGSRNLERHDSS